MRLLPSPRYAVSAEWEHNGRDDSDFYQIIYDPNQDQLIKYQTYTTRFGCGWFATVTADYVKRNNLSIYQTLSDGKALVTLPVEPFVPLNRTPEEILRRAEQLLADIIFNLIRNAEHNDIFEPNDAQFGQRLRLTEPHTYRDTKTGKRTLISAGDTGEVFWVGAFGTFYRNGYNHAGRHNRRVGLRLANGSRVFVPLKKCRLDKEPLTDDQLRERSVQLAKNRRFEQAYARVW